MSRNFIRSFYIVDCSYVYLATKGPDTTRVDRSNFRHRSQIFSRNHRSLLNLARSSVRGHGLLSMRQFCRPMYEQP